MRLNSQPMGRYWLSGAMTGDLSSTAWRIGRSFMMNALLMAEYLNWLGWVIARELLPAATGQSYQSSIQ